VEGALKRVKSLSILLGGIWDVDDLFMRPTYDPILYIACVCVCVCVCLCVCMYVLHARTHACMHTLVLTLHAVRWQPLCVGILCVPVWGMCGTCMLFTSFSMT